MARHLARFVLLFPLLLAACTTVRVADTTPTGSEVPIQTTVSARFNTPLDPKSVSEETFRLEQPDGRPVKGDVHYEAAQRRAVFRPAHPLSYGTRYRALLLPQITDLEGRALRNGHDWGFVTEKASVSVTWSPNSEHDVNRPGGGYRLYYGSKPNFDLKTAAVIDIPYESGDIAPTAITVPLSAGTYYFRVTAYSGAYPEGSEPSAEISLTVP